MDQLAAGTHRAHFCCACACTRRGSRRWTSAGTRRRCVASAESRTAVRCRQAAPCPSSWRIRSSPPNGRSTVRPNGRHSLDPQASPDRNERRCHRLVANPPIVEDPFEPAARILHGKAERTRCQAARSNKHPGPQGLGVPRHPRACSTTETPAATWHPIAPPRELREATDGDRPDEDVDVAAGQPDGEGVVIGPVTRRIGAPARTPNIAAPAIASDLPHQPSPAGQRLGPCRPSHRPPDSASDPAAPAIAILDSTRRTVFIRVTPQCSLHYGPFANEPFAAEGPTTLLWVDARCLPWPPAVEHVDVRTVRSEAGVAGCDIRRSRRLSAADGHLRPASA